MKVHAKELKLILTAALLLQIGCTNPNSAMSQKNAVTAAPTALTGQQGVTEAGNVFTRPQQGAQGGYSSSLQGLNDALARAQHEGMIPGGQQQGTGPGAQRTQQTVQQTQQNDNTQANENAPAPKKDVTFEVDRSEENRASCSNKTLTKDDDGDRLSNYCEENPAKDEIGIGLDPQVYNGFFLAARTFTKERKKDNQGQAADKSDDPGLNSIKLSDSEKKTYKSSEYAANIEISDEGSNDRLDKLFALKYFARYVQHRNKSDEKDSADLRALKDMMNIVQPGAAGKGAVPIKASSEAKIIMKDDALAGLGVTTGVGVGAVPFPIRGAKSISDLTGIESNTLGVTVDSGFLYVAEGFVVPEDMNGNRIRVGRLISNESKASMGSKAGMFLVIVNGSSEIITSDMMNDKEEGSPLQRNEGELVAFPGCRTAHVVIAFFSDKKADPARNLFSENFFYQKTGEEKWRPLSQDMIRTQPLALDGQTCDMGTRPILFDAAEKYLKP